MKRAIIPIIITLAVAVSGCGPSRKIKTSSRTPGIAFEVINIGAYNNDPGADKARTAFNKANQSIVELNRLKTYNLEEAELAILQGATVTTAELNRISGVTSAVQTQINGRVRAVDSTGNAAGNYVTRKALADTVTNKSARIVRDTITDYLNNATVGIALQDSNLYNGGYATRTFVESLLGSGEGMTSQRLPFIIGTTAGAPANADTIVTHTSFSGKHIDLYRDGAKQYQNSTATNTIDGFRVSGSNVIVKPAWTTGEQVIIDITEPVFWSSLAFEGEESSLLTGLSGYWKLDETSGTTATDATGTQNGVSLGTVGVIGKIGYANSFDAAAEVVRIPYNESVAPSGSAFSVSLWVWFDSIPSTVTGLEGYYLFNQMNSASPYEPQNIQFKAFNDRIYGVARNTSGSQYDVSNNATLSDSAWHHVVLVVRGNSQTLQLYIDGSDVSTSAQTFTGTLFEANSYTNFGNAYGGASEFVRGRIDECAIWSRALTSGEVSTLYNSGNGRTYPFN